MSTTSTPAAVTPSTKAAARRPHVASHHHPLGAGEAGERPADGPADLLVELVGHQAAHVVGLEDGVEGAHGALTLLPGVEGVVPGAERVVPAPNEWQRAVSAAGRS
jgi:hypothetical protein